MCTTLTNNQTIIAPTDACTGTISNLTVSSELTIPFGKTLTVTGLSITAAGSIIVEGTLRVNNVLNGYGNITVNPGGKMIMNTTSSHLNMYEDITVNFNGELTCNGDFSIASGKNCFLDTNSRVSMLKNNVFNGTLELLANNGTRGVLTLSNSSVNTTTFNAANNFVQGEVKGGAKIIMNSGISPFGVDCCRFQMGALEYNEAANGIDAGGAGAYLEINGNITGTGNALTPDSTIEVYRSGTGGNLGSATVLGSAKVSPC